MLVSNDRGAATDDRPEACVLHASCVAFGGRAVLISGPSGSGKSALSLQLMALGAGLVSDDQTVLRVRGGCAGVIWASAPAPLRGMIEARGIGLLAAETVARAPVVLTIDMELTESERLPPIRTQTLLGRSVPLLHKVESSYFPAAILQYLKGERRA